MDSSTIVPRALTRYSRETLVKELGVELSTIKRWENGARPSARNAESLERILASGGVEPSSARLRTVDLFAGVGGIRLGFEKLGYSCELASEWNDFSRTTYSANFESAAFKGDIKSINECDVPDHEILLAGFPCQPFSIAGVSKRQSLGTPHGFECDTQGTLFFDVARILAEKRPPAFLLENVKNLQSHDGGRTFARIVSVLEDELDYRLRTLLIDGSKFTPQRRERIVFVGFRKEDEIEFEFDEVDFPEIGPKLGSVLHRQDGSEPFLPWDGDRFFDHANHRAQAKYTLTPKLWEYLQAYAMKHRKAGNGFGFGLVGPEDVARTLSARYYKDGSEILVRQQGEAMRPRRLTPRECARLMGFPDTFLIPVSDTQAYRQFGNSVVVPMITAVARAVDAHLRPLVDAHTLENEQRSIE
ncbi:MAG: DNA (cytosine-5-)-methyltransferase [Thermoleophilaceae bacterium]|nr:DNA (cytosine-5-)-methyltransferase [Thermoleophilaceae bacterium]